MRHLQYVFQQTCAVGIKCGSCICRMHLNWMTSLGYDNDDNDDDDDDEIGDYPVF